MESKQRRLFLKGLSVTSLGTLLSRVLGMLRDMATATLLGLSKGGVMDAFVIAFRIPNLFRRLFGEGALTASYLPELTNQLHQNRKDAWSLVTGVAIWSSLVLLGLLLMIELFLLYCWWNWPEDPKIRLLVSLTASMLPYTILICLAAQLSATLQVLLHFRTPAFVPVVLNVCWLTTAIFVAPFFSDPISIAYILTGSILLGGVLQVSIQLPVLWKFGFRPQYHSQISREAIRRVAKNMIPLMFGLAVTQINVFLDSMIAWGFSSDTNGPIYWLSEELQYPMQQGAAAATYIGQRLYHFPVGVLGMAIATVIFPLLSQHASRGERHKLSQDVTFGLRLVTFLSLPAGVGLMILSEPIIRLLFQYGEFSSDDTTRAANVLVQYGIGVWAFCCIPVVTRGYYALQLRSTVVKIGMMTVLINFVLNVSLIWPLAEAGLALATSISATLQAVILVVILIKHVDSKDSNSTVIQLFRCFGRTLVVCALMVAACYATKYAWVQIVLFEDKTTFWKKVADVALPMSVSMVVYLIASRTITPKEYRMTKELLLGNRDKE